MYTVIGYTEYPFSSYSLNYYCIDILLFYDFPCTKKSYNQLFISTNKLKTDYLVCNLKLWLMHLIHNSALSAAKAM